MQQAGLLPAGLPPGAHGLFTLRTGGVSQGPYGGLNLARHVGDDDAAVTSNRAVLAGWLGVPLGRLWFPEQVHGAAVAVASGPAPAGGAPGVDAVVSADPDVGLVVLAADCLPVLFADTAAGVVGAAHAGRNGLLAGVLENTVAALVALGATRPGLVAVIGPGVCGRCYELPRELVVRLEELAPGSACTSSAGRAAADLPRAAEVLLRAGGVGDVRRVRRCTVEDPDGLYSYRRDQVTGRQAGAVRLRAAGSPR